MKRLLFLSIFLLVACSAPTAQRLILDQDIVRNIDSCDESNSEICELLNRLTDEQFYRVVVHYSEQNCTEGNALPSVQFCSE